MRARRPCWHEVLVDPAGRPIVASGSEDAAYFTSGTNAVAFAPLDVTDGAVGSWTSVVAPEVLDFDADAALVGGALYASAGGDGGHRRHRARGRVARRGALLRVLEQQRDRHLALGTHLRDGRLGRRDGRRRCPLDVSSLNL